MEAFETFLLDLVMQGADLDLFFARLKRRCPDSNIIFMRGYATDPLKTGDVIPDVVVRTEEGEPVYLRTAGARQPAVIVFYRGGWCPYCTGHLSALAEIEDDVAAAGYQVLAISMDRPSVLAKTPNREELRYELLSDSSAEAVRAFGIAFQIPAELVVRYKTEYKIDLEASSGETHHLLPHPAVYVVDRTGMIQFAYVNENYRERLEPGELLEVIRRQAR